MLSGSVLTGLSQNEIINKNFGKSLNFQNRPPGYTPGYAMLIYTITQVIYTMKYLFLTVKIKKTYVASFRVQIWRLN